MGSFGFDQPDLEESEDVLGVFYGGRGQVGGQLIVTTRRLLFGPIDTGLARSIVLEGGAKAGLPGTDVVKSLLDAYEPLKRKQVWLRHIASVEARGQGGIFSAPSLRIVTATGEVIDYAIVTSTTTPNFARGNRETRDQAVATIQRAVEVAKARPA